MTITDKATLTSLHSKAMELMAARKDEDALTIFGQIVDFNPNIAEVHFQVARIFLRNDRLSRALTHIRAAVRLKPGIGDIWKVYADLIRTLSDPEAQGTFRTALKDAPLEKREKRLLSTSVDFTGRQTAPLSGTPPKAFAAMVAALTSGDSSRAQSLAKAELKRNPKAPAVTTVLAAAQLAQGRLKEAEASCQDALALDPRYAEAHATLARILRATQRISDCVAACNRALRLSPGLPAALRMRADCCMEVGRREDAQRDFESLIAIDPKTEDNYVAYIRFLHGEKEYFQAIDIARRAIKRGVGGFALKNVFAQALDEAGRSEEALKVFEEAVALVPESGDAIGRIALLKQSLGRFDEAMSDLRRAIAIDPTNGSLHRIYLTSQKLDADDPLVASMEAKFLDDKIPPIRRTHFGFALAKAAEDQKRFDQVFGYLNPANALMREEFPYDIAARVTFVDQLIAACKDFDWLGAPTASKSDFAPIFVTGMPRSGTTLVEQIIASHSRVTGGDEVGVASKWALQLLSRDGEEPITFDELPGGALERVADRFEAYMRALLPGSDLVTDKAIQSFTSIGLLKRAMPKAKIVVVRRDPRDNLLSIYK
ncbi:MAG: tetratricopeptide repeat protein, partial [Pseudomonadota bacterium]